MSEFGCISIKLDLENHSGLDWCMDLSCNYPLQCGSHTEQVCPVRKEGLTLECKQVSLLASNGGDNNIFQMALSVTQKDVFVCMYTYVHTDLTSFYFNFRHTVLQT